MTSIHSKLSKRETTQVIRRITIFMLINVNVDETCTEVVALLLHQYSLYLTKAWCLNEYEYGDTNEYRCFFLISV